MSSDRRNFLKAGASLAAFGLAAASATANAEATPGSAFSRYAPSRGSSPDADDYLGKLVPGLRAPGLAPVSFQTPDLKPPLSHEMINGRKTFRLSCEVVKREFLPGKWMDVWGYNGSMPGPTIECVQGDRIRVIVTNNLPEPTSVHWHGLELINDMDGVPGVTQDAIPAGKSFTYEFDMHQVGSFFYHSHIAMQEAMGMVGWLIIHPKVAYDPVCDRDFGLIFQNFAILPNQTIPDSRSMEWNWHTINGRSAPYTTPMLIKHGERVRVRLLNFSPEQHHPLHFHGHTFWLTATEGGRIPRSAWLPRNNNLVGVGMVHEFEFVANNPGDWIFHCHMVHHMMNHMVYPAGPDMRPDQSVEDYQKALPDIPEQDTDVKTSQVPGYPEDMVMMPMDAAGMKKIMGRKEVGGMRKGWMMGMMGMMTLFRVLPEDLYDKVMSGKSMSMPGHDMSKMSGDQSMKGQDMSKMSGDQSMKGHDMSGMSGEMSMPGMLKPGSIYNEVIRRVRQKRGG